jgi:hypothetical protein
MSRVDALSTEKACSWLQSRRPSAASATAALASRSPHSDGAG